jgi:multisubunit Na+/H+ antiporter MnhB subunit
MIEIIIVVIILLMIVGALVAIETPRLLHSVISIGAVGFLLSIVFLFLSAPDLAITQIAVEVITLVLLLRATQGSEQDEPVSGGRISFNKVAAMVMVIVLGIFSARMFAEFPEFGSPVIDRFADAPSNTYLRDGLEETGAANIVTAVLLDFRAYDTLGEATVLFCAVMGAISVLRPKAKKHSQEADEEEAT